MSRVDEIKEITLPVVERHGCDLVQLTLRNEKQGRVLRLLIEKKGSDPFTGCGVDHAVCASISRDLSDALEVEGPIDGAFTLEVSSPGIERPLVSPEDYTRFAGRPVTIKTSRAHEGRKRFKGTLEGSKDGMVTLRLEGGGNAKVPFDLISKANLVFDPKAIETKTGE